MPPAQLHRVLADPLHADCTLATCEMLRGCHLMLDNMGHLHPDGSLADCGECTEPRPPNRP